MTNWIEYIHINQTRIISKNSGSISSKHLIRLQHGTRVLITVFCTMLANRVLQSRKTLYVFVFGDAHTHARALIPHQKRMNAIPNFVLVGHLFWVYLFAILLLLFSIASSLFEIIWGSDLYSCILFLSNEMRLRVYVRAFCCCFLFVVADTICFYLCLRRSDTKCTQLYTHHLSFVIQYRPFIRIY